MLAPGRIIPILGMHDDGAGRRAIVDASAFHRDAAFAVHALGMEQDALVGGGTGKRIGFGGLIGRLLPKRRGGGPCDGRQSDQRGKAKK